jgi:hypothetical protein
MHFCVHSRNAFMFHWNIYYRRGKGSSLYKRCGSAQILDYCLKYADSTQSGQAILSEFSWEEMGGDPCAATRQQKKVTRDQ